MAIRVLIRLGLIYVRVGFEQGYFSLKLAAPWQLSLRTPAEAA